jgi:hypothetical protein
VIEDGTLRLGDLCVSVFTERDASVKYAGTPLELRVRQSRALLASAIGRTELSIDAVHRLAGASSEPQAGPAVDGLLGRGPGLTPAGDDVLCGMLAGGVLFGRQVEPVRSAVRSALGKRPRATTSLSRQLLERACGGEAVVELAFGQALCGEDLELLGRALGNLMAVGHSSGVALALGLLSAIGLPMPQAGPRPALGRRQLTSEGRFR